MAIVPASTVHTRCLQLYTFGASATLWPMWTKGRLICCVVSGCPFDQSPLPVGTINGLQDLAARQQAVDYLL